MPEEKPVIKMIVTVVRRCGECPNLQARHKGWRCSKLQKNFDFEVYSDFIKEIEKIHTECPLQDYTH